MDWKKYITEHINPIVQDTTFEFNTAAGNDQLAELRLQLQIDELPAQLEELYKQTNGIREILNGQPIGELIWSAERVIETNKEYRCTPGFAELYMSFDQLLFISDAGNGDLFGFVVLQGKTDRPDIFHWNHEDDSRTWIAADLKQFLKGWTDGTIHV